MNKVVVVGSLNVDLVTITNSLPKLGETVAGVDFETHFGGKGGNQAVAAKRSGANVIFLGCVGDDDFGERSIKSLDEEGIITKYIDVIPGKATGVASIWLCNTQNSIIVTEGANVFCNQNYINKNKSIIETADYVIIQNEIPNEANELVIKICLEAHVPLIYNPAPFREFNAHILEGITYLTPNETEYEKMNNIPPKKIVLTKGSKGVELVDSGLKFAAEKVKVIDTTGAGDTFSGYLAGLLAQSYPVHEAIALATKAASISTTKKGARSGIPYLREVEE